MFIRMVLLLVVAAGGSAGALAADAVPAWELTPYRVQILVAAERGGELPAHFEQDLATQIPTRILAATGGAWQLTVSIASEDLGGKIAKSLASISQGELPADSLTHDKVLLLGISRVPTGLRVQARELDVATQLWNGIVSRECQSAATLLREATGAALAAFAPLARIDTSDGVTARLRLKAAALGRQDTQSPVDPGTVFRPVLVRSDTSGKPAGSANIVPWTYLIPTGMTGGRLNCRVVTGLEGTPIPEYHPQRQRLALGVSASSATTNLKIVSNDEAAAPQEGYEVVEMGTDDEGKPVRLARVGASGTDGIVAVPPGSQAVRMLMVLHGDITLAKLPLVPGLASEVILPLPPAGRRVAIAAALASLEDDLIDRLARQQVLEQQITAAGDDTAAADKLRGQLRNLPGPDEFKTRLAEQEQALASADATAQQLLAAKVAAISQVIASLQ